jgi:hypothetical protein
VSREDQIKLEYDTLLEQYRVARAEIYGYLESSRQIVGLTLTAISLFLAVLAFVKAELPVIFLVLPLFLHGLAWIQLRYLLLTRRLQGYIARTLAPRLRVLLAEIAPDHRLDPGAILAWDVNLHNLPIAPRGPVQFVLLLPVLGASYGLPLAAACMSLAAYFASGPDYLPGEWLLLALNVAALTYSLLLGYWVEFRRLGRSA